MMRWTELLQINVPFFGLNTLTITNGFVLPLVVQAMVGDDQQGDYFGRVRLWSLMVSILAQSLMGVLSDRSSLHWGRRRPFILGGGLGTAALLVMVAYSPILRGQVSFLVLMLVLVLLQITFNTTHAGANGLIPDLVAGKRRGVASGLKALLEVPLPLLFAAVCTGPLISQGKMRSALLIAVAIFLVTVVISQFAKEPTPVKGVQTFPWKTYGQLFMMTAFFAGVILFLGEFVRLTTRSSLQYAGNLLQPIEVGVVGLTCIVLALLVGTWISLHIGLGKGALRENPSYGWWMVHRMAFLASIFNMGIFSLYFIQSRLGIEGEQAAGPGAFFMALLGILLASSTLPSGWLADHFGKKPMVALGCLAAAVGTAILLSSRQMAAILMGGALIGIGAGIVYATSWALGVDLVPPDQAGKYLGIQNLAAAGAGAVGAYLGGPVADCFSRSFPGLPGIGYSVLYAMFGVLLLVSAAALWRVKVTINTRNVNQDVQRQEGGG